MRRHGRIGYSGSAPMYIGVNMATATDYYRGYGTVPMIGTIAQTYWDVNYAQQQSYPQKPVYNFSFPVYDLTIKRGEFKLMPIGFDHISETVAKSLNKPEQKGGDTRKRIMPRLFRYMMYIGLTYVVLDTAFHFNDIINFIVHTFILHK